MNKLFTFIALAIMYVFTIFSASASTLVDLGSDGNAVLDYADMIGANDTLLESKSVESGIDGVYRVVEKMPTFPGGDEAMSQFIYDNLKYPHVAQVYGFQGRVIVQFTVNADGSISDVEAIQSVHPSLDNEAIRVVKAMPKWNPGLQRGKAVRVKYSLPMTFRLPEPVEPVVENAEVAPSFLGGQQALNEWISNNLVYPEEEKAKGIEGEVVVGFVVEKDSSLTLLGIEKGLTQPLNLEALKLVLKMPKWSPGKQDGNNVRARSRISVVYGSEVHSVVDIQPCFKGGQEELMRFLMNNMKYPSIAMDNGIQGRVLVQFVVNTNGSISDIAIQEGVDASLDKEALRVVKSMTQRWIPETQKWVPETQRWIPGFLNGKPVRTRYTLPITFKLGNPSTTDEKPVVENEAETESTENIELTKEDTGEGEVLQVAERMPMFPGGDNTLMNWLYHAIKYPSIAHDKGIQGRVMVQFTVDKDGSIVDPEIFKGVHPALDEEALKVVKSMPKWTTGMQKGKTVRVRYTMPIMFRLQ